MPRFWLGAAAVFAALVVAASTPSTEAANGSYVQFHGPCGSLANAPVSQFQCVGFAIVAGEQDATSLSEAIASAASERFGEAYTVTRLWAFSSSGGFITEPDSGCFGSPGNQTERLWSGYWVVFFRVEPCEPEEQLVAVAYTDVDPDDGLYNPAADVLIAKLVDVDYSGTVTAGDKIVTNRYPLDFDFQTAGFGAFQVTEYVLVNPDVVAGNDVDVYDNATDFGFQFLTRDLFEAYNEYSNDGDTSVSDGYTASQFILAEADSPSQPSPPVSLVLGAAGGDDQFVDIDIYLPPVP
ncbi:MAG: hypothetical protein AB7L91_04400 [Dehalococcoidia bacterium]